MKEFKKEIKVNLDIYESEIILLYGYTYKEVKKWLKSSNLTSGSKDRIAAWYDYYKDDYMGVYHKDGFKHLINIKGQEDIHQVVNTVAHEVTHCVFALTKYVGIKLSGKSEEAYTYLMGYIMGEVHKQLVEPLIEFKNRKYGN